AELGAVLDAVVVRVDVGRIRERHDRLDPVGDAVVVGVGVERIGRVAVAAGNGLLAVENAVAVGVGIVGIGAEAWLDGVGQSVAVAIHIVPAVARDGIALARIEAPVVVDILVAVGDAAVIAVRVERVGLR